MRQAAFEAQHGEVWTALEAWLKGQSTLEPEEIVAAYRKVCQHIALCQARYYSVTLRDRLQNLALDVHQRLYKGTQERGAFWAFVTTEFPAQVRKEWRLALLSCLLLFGSWLAMFFIIRQNPERVYLILSPAQAADIAQMYRPDVQNNIGQMGAMRDVQMFGHYIVNNIGIDFQVFASGLILGIGPLFSLVFNGLFGGAAMAHLSNLGLTETFYGFVSGHSSFELLGLAISGTGGLKLGLAFIHPGNLSRKESLKKQGREGATLAFGAALMTFIAAIIEGFWSANTFTPWQAKLGLGIVFWLLLIAYFLLSGRARQKS